MKKRLFLKNIFSFLLIFLIFALPVNASFQTEVIYPSFLDTILLEKATAENALPIFMAYMFRLLLFASVVTAGGVIIYGGVLYLFSLESPERRKSAKTWIVSALQGVFIVLLSHMLLSLLDSRFLFFNMQKLEETKKTENLKIDWEIEHTYFQVPFGLLIEETALNNNGRDRFYDILDAVYDAEDTADAITLGGKDILGIIDICPDIEEGNCMTYQKETVPAVVLNEDTFRKIGSCPFGYFECCEESPFCNWPPIPFSSLQREKIIRPDLLCWWNSSAIKTESPLKIKRPDLKPLPQKMDYTHIDIVFYGQKMRLAAKELEDALEGHLSLSKIEEKKVEEIKKSLRNLILKIEKATSRPKRAVFFTEEIRKISGEIKKIEEKFPELQKTPFKEALNNLAGEWIEKATLFNKDTGYNNVPFIDQIDARWRHVRYGWGTVARSGCLLASTVMAFKDLGIDIDIFTAVNFATKHNHIASPLGGTSFTFPCHIASEYTLNCKRVSFPGRSHFNTLVNWLETKGSVVIGGAGYPWSSSPSAYHALVLTGVDRNKRVIYMSNTSAPFVHSATFSEVMANMPKEIAYISHKKISNNVEENRIVLSNGNSCEDCPEISCAINAKLSEIYLYMGKHFEDLWVVLFSKDLKKEDLYQLYKALMIKSLGVENIISYPSFILEKSFYGKKEKVTTKTDSEFTKIYRFGNKGRSNPYTWSWEKWLGNTLYKSSLNCNVSEENDPLTFYIKENTTVEKLISDALIELAYQKKQEDLQHIDIEKRFPLDSSSLSPLGRNYEKIRELAREIFYIFSTEEAFAETFEDCLQRNNITDIESLSPQELAEILSLCGKDIKEDYFDLRNIKVDSPGDFLSCGEEIPVGEAFQITWDHVIELLFALDGYIAEGLKLLELQEIMNATATLCSCPCADPCCDCTPPSCGHCTLTCDKVEIEDFYYSKIIPQREKLKEVALYIEHLTHGFFYHSTEDITAPLNSDIRDYKETGFITKHELITRKLNLSRSVFDNCFLRPEYLEEIEEGKNFGSVLVFGPIAEKNNLERLTKTKKGGIVINTHPFNWFCCSDKRAKE